MKHGDTCKVGKCLKCLEGVQSGDILPSCRLSDKRLKCRGGLRWLGFNRYSSSSAALAAPCFFVSKRGKGGKQTGLPTGDVHADVAARLQ